MAKDKFKNKTSSALAKIKEYKALEAEDPMIAAVLDIGRNLFSRPLDKTDTGELLTWGGKLSGAYGYLGQKSAYARAERDVYEQKLSEVEKELLLSYLDEKYKVSEARAKISSETEAIKELVIHKEAVKNQWEHIVNACEKMISFIQSAIKVKENQRFQGRNLQDNG